MAGRKEIDQTMNKHLSSSKIHTSIYSTFIGPKRIFLDTHFHSENRTKYDRQLKSIIIIMIIIHSVKLQS